MLIGQYPPIMASRENVFKTVAVCNDTIDWEGVEIPTKDWLGEKRYQRGHLHQEGRVSCHQLWQGAPPSPWCVFQVAAVCRSIDDDVWSDVEINLPVTIISFSPYPEWTFAIFKHCLNFKMTRMFYPCSWVSGGSLCYQIKCAGGPVVAFTAEGNDQSGMPFGNKQ